MAQLWIVGGKGGRFEEEGVFALNLGGIALLSSAMSMKETPIWYVNKRANGGSLWLRGETAFLM